MTGSRLELSLGYFRGGRGHAGRGEAHMVSFFGFFFLHGGLRKLGYVFFPPGQDQRRGDVR